MLLLLFHAAATLFMTGLVWFVQIVHYPLFGLLGRDVAVDYAAAHQRLTTWVVGPPMLIELTTALLLVGRPPAAGLRLFAFIGLALLVAVWGSTAFLQAPLHRLLAAGRNEEVEQRLVRTNWIRTVAWSLRALLALYMILLAYRSVSLL